MDILSGISIAVLCCGVSTHLTNDYEPKGGYNETHETIGVLIEQNKNKGLVYGAQAFYFKDSFDKPSALYAGRGGYRWSFLSDDLAVTSGVGVGYVETSYYKGALVLPVVDVDYKRVGVQFSYLPKVKGGDAVAAVQFKIKMN